MLLHNQFRISLLEELELAERCEPIKITVHSEQVAIVPLRRCSDQTVDAPGCDSAGSTGTIQGRRRHMVLSGQIKKLEGLELILYALCQLGIRDSLQHFLDDDAQDTHLIACHEHVPEPISLGVSPAWSERHRPHRGIDQDSQRLLELL